MYGHNFLRIGSRSKAQLIMLPQLIQDTQLKVDDIIGRDVTKTVSEHSGLVVFLPYVPPACALEFIWSSFEISQTFAGLSFSGLRAG